MAIAFGGNLSASITNASSQTVSFTVSGANPYLVVGILIQGGFTCTGVTYGGQPMTLLTTQSASNVSANETNYIFGLANAPTGANNIVASYSGASTNAITASYFTGAQAGLAVEASGSTQNSTTSASQAVTTITNNDWLVGFARGSGNTTAGSNTIIRGAQNNINMMDSNGVQSPTGSYSLNFTSASTGWAIQVIALKPYTAGIDYDNSTQLAYQASATSITYAHTTGLGANRRAMIAVFGSSTDLVTGVTYAGVSATLVGKIQNGADNFVYLFTLANPASGSNNVVVSASSAQSMGSAIATYVGTSQGSIDNSATTTAAAASTWTASVTTVADNCWAVAAVRDNVGRAATAGANTVVRQDGAGQGYHLLDTNSPKTPPGTDTMNISSFATGATPATATVIASMAPFVASAIRANPLLTNQAVNRASTY